MAERQHRELQWHVPSRTPGPGPVRELARGEDRDRAVPMGVQQPAAAQQSEL